MKKLVQISSIIVLFCLIQNTALSQALDGNLIIGKWKFVKATLGPNERDYKHNGQPLLSFAKTGKWVTEDTNPDYQQKGTWRIEGSNLVRDPEKILDKDLPAYPREIKKLTKNELVLAVVNDGLTNFTFYFSKIE